MSDADNVAPPTPLDAGWRLKQLELTNKFRTFRHVYGHDSALQLNQIPVFKAKHQVHHGTYAVNNINYEVFRRGGFRSNYRRSVGDLPDDKRQYSQTRIKEVSRTLFALDIRFRRILSCGGMGMAALFEVQNRATGLFSKVVAKIALKERYNYQIRKEKRYLSVLAHDDHILQVKSVDDMRHMAGGYASEPVNGGMPADPSAQQAPSAKALQALDADAGIMMTEYLAYGTLGHWIGKASELGQRFSTEACWRMLLCMAKACQSLERPPPQTGAAAAAAGDEDAGRVQDIVHFDLDPTNILVDGAAMAAHASRQQQQQHQQYGQRSKSKRAAAAGDRRPVTRAQRRVLEAHKTACTHDRALRLKLADFGVAQDMDDAIKDNAKQLWLMRSHGKERFYAPEQWTAEWDAVVANPVREHMDIAGAYASKMNLYQIGLAMMCVMMHTYPEPYPRLYNVLVADYTDAGYRDAIGVPGPYAALPRVGISTPAWILAQHACAALYEPCLRDVVIRLTSYEPRFRPMPDELVALCEQRVARPFDDDDWPPTEADWVTTENLPAEPQPKAAYQMTHTTDDDDDDNDDVNDDGAPLSPYVPAHQDAPSPEAHPGPADAPMMDAYDPNNAMAILAQAALATRLAGADMDDAAHVAPVGVTDIMTGVRQTSHLVPSALPSPNAPWHQIPGRYLYAAPSAVRGSLPAGHAAQGAAGWGPAQAIENARAAFAAQVAQAGFHGENGFVHHVQQAQPAQPAPAPAQNASDFDRQGQAQPWHDGQGPQ